MSSVPVCNYLVRSYGDSNSFSSLFSSICSSNHKTLGLYYLFLALLYGIMGTTSSLLIRMELYSSGLHFIPPANHSFYNLTFTLHGLIMIFFTVMPGLYSAFGNYLIPILIGSPEVAFPRINSISLFLLPISYGCLLLSCVTEFSSGNGWTLYPPLSTSASTNFSTDAIIIALVLSGLSSLLTSINFITTIVHQSPSGLRISILHLFVISFFFVAVMLISTLPVLTAALLILISDIHFNTLFFDPAFSGDPVFYQHLFWFFGHPEVYILILPAFAVISLILSQVKMIFGSQSMILALGCISILGMLVWGHHMTTVGMDADTRAYFTAVTLLISLPTGTKIFNWLSTHMGSYSYCSPAITFALLFLITFTLGGTTGVVLGHAALDVALHDTYYVIAHFHFVLSLAAVLALFAGVFSLLQTFFGVSMYPTLTIFFFCFLFFTGILLTFIPMHFLGFHVMPRRIPDFPDCFNSWNMIASFGASLTVVSSILGFACTLLIQVIRKKKKFKLPRGCVGVFRKLTGPFHNWREGKCVSIFLSFHYQIISPYIPIYQGCKCIITI